MTKTQTIGCWVCVLLSAALSGCNQEGREDIVQAHADWDQAYLDRDGERFYELLALPAQDYYSRILSYARSANRLQIEQSPAMERFQILLLRQMLTGKEMAALDGKSFVVMTIDEGWFDPANAWTETIRGIKFSGENYASAEMVLDGEPQDVRYGFVRELGQWKVDDTQVDDAYNAFIRLEAAYEGMTENQYIVGWVEEATEEPMPDSLWDSTK